MKLFQLDTHADYSTGAGPLALCVQTLDTLTRSPDVQWKPGQHAAACRLVHDARKLLEVDVLTLAGQVYPPRTPHDPLPEARLERLSVGDGYEWKPAK